MRTVKLFLYGLLGLLIVLFVIQNYTTLTYSVSIRFNLGFLALESMPLPFFVIAPALFFTGVLLATLLGWFERRSLIKELKQLKACRMDIDPSIKPVETLSNPPNSKSATADSSPEQKTSLNS